MQYLRVGPPSNFNQFPQWAVAGFLNQLRGIGASQVSRFLWFISSASAHVSRVVIFWHIGRICQLWAPPPISLLTYYWMNARYSTKYNAVYRHLIDIFELKCMKINTKYVNFMETVRALFEYDNWQVWFDLNFHRYAFYLKFQPFSNGLKLPTFMRIVCESKKF